MSAVAYLALGCLLAASVASAFAGDEKACVLWAGLAIGFLENQRILAERLREGLADAHDAVRLARIERDKARTLVRTLEQSNDHEDAIDGPPGPVPSALESGELRQRWRRQRGK